MINAKEARKATSDYLTKTAKEFVWNVVSTQVRDAVDNGRFFAVISMRDMPNLEQVGPVVVDILEKEYGFETKLNLEDSAIIVKWDNEEVSQSKKYRYNVSYQAEDVMEGTIDLTKREAAIVAFATNSDNWNYKDGGGYCGSFFIDIDNPREIVEVPDED